MLSVFSVKNKAIFLVLFVLFLDQSLKIWIKTHMIIGQEYHLIGNWFCIHFIENYGMAFGIEFGGRAGKLLLGLLRISAIIAIIWYLNELIRKKAKTGLVLSIALILAGAIGNMLDSFFYGMIFNEHYGATASLFQQKGIYSAFLNGKVVDMLYFPIIHGNYPQWIPILGGRNFLFFRHIFNLADASIFSGLVYILIFQKNFYRTKTTANNTKKVDSDNLDTK